MFLTRFLCPRMLGSPWVARPAVRPADTLCPGPACCTTVRSCLPGSQPPVRIFPASSGSVNQAAELQRSGQRRPGKCMQAAGRRGMAPSYEQLKASLEAHGQAHLLDGWAQLNEAQQQQLAADIQVCVGFGSSGAGMQNMAWLGACSPA